MPRSDFLGGGDPARAFLFTLEIDGVDIGAFSHVTGLELHVGVEEYAEGGQNGFVHKLPGRITWPNIVFSRGITNNDALFEWVSRSSGEGFAAQKDTLTRTTGAVSLLADDYTRLRSWSLIDPFPVRWSGPRLSAEDSTPLTEEVEVAHHGFTAKTLT